MESTISSRGTPVLLSGSPIPRIIYGTARREGKTLPNVLAALDTGYRAIDTATSRRFHHEAEDGQAITQYLDANTMSVHRDDIFIQSKYATPTDQTNPWPYDIMDDTRSRVFKSVLRCASNLDIDVIDVYFLSAPTGSLDGTLNAWHALESIANRGGIRYLGICNVRIARLRKLYEQAQVKPSFVQNWFRKVNGYDREVMGFCREHGLVYQIFGVFDGENIDLLDCEPVQRHARSNSITNHQALLQILLVMAAARGLHLCILDGTTSTYHMGDNLKAVSQVEETPDAEHREFSDLIGWT
ncbi:NADP-dependent oxidoreductase domain-containing protein [Hypoxylon rubiginosum]|uniref:NADP-dependent oxidoreductase domain-containing protein n=1 Tax=Hypoxylon rubiginosum TaxID=110542 RepID=A0ACB9ZDI0_9PEZI|nr:NADP-dependent oxidoreductase domain-containing protein [Hypoxylon rubiginosum]